MKQGELVRPKRWRVPMIRKELGFQEYPLRGEDITEDDNQDAFWRGFILAAFISILLFCLVACNPAPGPVDAWKIAAREAQR
jgi:hypothetical protein